MLKIIAEKLALKQRNRYLCIEQKFFDFMKTSELKRLLSRKGCYFVKQGARHERWYSPITGAVFSVPRHDAQEIGRSTLKAIKEQAGV